MKTSRLSLAILAVALLVPSLGCSSMTRVRIGQLETGGHVSITDPGLSLKAADDGLGFVIQLGHLQIGATTTLDTAAEHLVLGIKHSTGFDGEEDTLLTSATRIGVANASAGGEVALGLMRFTLEGVAKISSGPLLPAIYGDHWTGMTSKYEPFPDVTGNVSGGMLDCSSYLALGPFGLTAGAGVLNECRPGSAGCLDGQCNAGLGPFLLNAGATNGECSQGLGCGFYLGITDAPDSD